MALGDWWPCPDCGRPFAHARLMVRHRLDFHGRRLPESRCQTPLMR